MMKKQCPLLKKACMQDKCVWWIDFAVARAGDAENIPAERRWDCNMNWSAIFQYSGNHRLLCNQAATESLRNMTVEQNGRQLALSASLVASVDELHQTMREQGDGTPALPAEPDKKRLTHAREN